MDAFLQSNETFESLLGRFGVELAELPANLADDMSRRDMSHEFIWAWCQAGELFARTQRLTPCLCELLARDDHEGHEELADSLQNLRDPSTVDCLHDRAIRQLPYLAYNDSEALARKCIWALHDIGTPSAIAKLSLLANDPREEVSGGASRRLQAIAQRTTDDPEPYRAARDAELGSL